MRIAPPHLAPPTPPLSPPPSTPPFHTTSPPPPQWSDPYTDESLLAGFLKAVELTGGLLCYRIAQPSLTASDRL
jgi:hypothetical protein